MTTAAAVYNKLKHHGHQEIVKNVFQWILPDLSSFSKPKTWCIVGLATPLRCPMSNAWCTDDLKWFHAVWCLHLHICILSRWATLSRFSSFGVKKDALKLWERPASIHTQESSINFDQSVATNLSADLPTFLEAQELLWDLRSLLASCTWLFENRVVVLTEKKAIKEMLVSIGRMQKERSKSSTWYYMWA